MAQHLVAHLLHDVGLATWFGGSLMGATGLNGAAAALSDPRERTRAATRGWSRWAPVNAAGIAAHVIGGTALTVTDWPRVRTQEGLGRSTAVKTAVTAAALGVTAWSGVLNRRMAAAGAVPAQGATEPGPGTPPDVARTQRQLAAVQWLIPALTAGVLASSSWHEEQQRAAQQVPGVLRGLSARVPGGALPLVLAGGAGLLLAARRRAASTSDAGHVAYLDATPAPGAATTAPGTGSAGTGTSSSAGAAISPPIGTSAGTGTAGGASPPGTGDAPAVADLPPVTAQTLPEDPVNDQGEPLA